MEDENKYKNVKPAQREAMLSLDIFREYKGGGRDTWAQHIREDEQFRHNVQWTKQQKDRLADRGHSAVVINQIDAAIQASKAVMTARRPSWTAVGREDTDVKIAKVAEKMLEHMYDISNGNLVMDNAVDDFLSKSMAAYLVYYDPIAYNGRGRVKFIDIDPLEVFIDPNSKRRDVEDAEHILIVRNITRKQAIKLFPHLASKINKSTAANESIYPTTDKEAIEGQMFPGDVDSSERDKLNVIERYTKKQVNLFHVIEAFTGSEYVYTKEELDAYLQKQYYVVGDQIFEEDDQQGLMYTLSNMDVSQIDQITIATGSELVEMQQISVRPVRPIRVHRYLSIEQELLESEMMNLEEYPIKIAMNKWSRTPYPESDVRYAKGIQQYINKTNSLIIAHATTATNIKLLLPEGSMDAKKAAEEWGKPNAVMTYNPEFGTPFVPQHPTLPGELYQNIGIWKQDIRYQFGVPELMHGFSENSPQTYRGTMVMEEFGQRKIRSKMRIIENAMEGVARVAFRMMQAYYTEDEVFRVVQPSGSVSEVRINYMGVDDFSGEIRKFNDISIGEYDFKFVGGSTLPSNRWAEFEYYVQLYQMRAIDQIELLKKTELVDVDGVLNRFNYVKQLESNLQALQAEVKKLRGDLQTAERESLHDRKRVELEKFKSDLNEGKSKATAAAMLFDARLNDELKNIKNAMNAERKSKNAK